MAHLAMIGDLKRVQRPRHVTITNIQYIYIYTITRQMTIPHCSDCVHSLQHIRVYLMHMRGD